MVPTVTPPPSIGIGGCQGLVGGGGEWFAANRVTTLTNYEEWFIARTRTAAMSGAVACHRQACYDTSQIRYDLSDEWTSALKKIDESHLRADAKRGGTRLIQRLMLIGATQE